MTDFANVLANPNYKDINEKASALNTAVQTLVATTNTTNLIAAQNAWRELRTPWEQCEGFLFGPVEDFNFDPITDTWPVDKVRMDSLLASTNPLSLTDIDAPSFDYALKGYHPIEYMLFGLGGTRVADSLTTRQKTYLASLTQSLYNTTTAMRNSWDVNQSGNFTNDLITAGTGSTRFATKKDAFIAIVTAMASICDEVGGGKMQDPLVGPDSTLEESQFSHNSTADFRNNIVGVQNAYLCKYNGSNGRSLHDLVATKNLQLDKNIQQQLTAAINSFNTISSKYGEAVYTQQIQIQNAQAAIATLKTSLETDLMNFIATNIKD